MATVTAATARAGELALARDPTVGIGAATAPPNVALEAATEATGEAEGVSVATPTP